MIDIKKASIKLLEKNLLFAGILSRFSIEEEKTIPTMGVSLNDGVTLAINPDFWNKQGLSEQVALLEHEIYHVICKHPLRMKDYETKEYKKLNISGDCAINQYITGLPEGCVTLDLMSKFAGKSLKPFKTMEYYYHNIKNSKNESLNNSTCSGFRIVKGNKETIDRILKPFEKELKEYAKGLKAGELSEGLIREYSMQESDIDWLSYLRNLVYSSKCRGPNSWTVPNRRFKQFPGYKKNPEYKLVIAIDTSGSIDKDQLNKFMSELKRIISIGNIQAWIIYCDDKVHDFYEYKSKLKPVKGFGGTDFSPAIKVANKVRPDGLVYFTDLYGNFGGAPKYPVLWAVYNSDKTDVPFGRVFKIGGR